MFTTGGTETEIGDPSVTCPLGEFVSAVAGKASSTSRRPDTALRLASGARIIVYREPQFEAHLLLGDVSPKLAPGMTVAGCVAGVWRIRAAVPIAEMAFECRCVHLPPDADGGPTPGEGLDALTWTTPGWATSMGTEDGEFLRGRALRGDNMPRSLAEHLELGTVEYLSNGLRVPFRDVPADEVLQVQFVISSCEHQTEERSRTWFAVDQDPAFLVAALTK